MIATALQEHDLQSTVGEYAVLSAAQVVGEPPATANTLIVDDEPGIRRLFGRWLGDAGYECFEATSGQEAIDLLGDSDISVVTLDVSMPGKSGLETLAEIKERHPDVAVVMLTGIDEVRTAIAALSMGASGYLIKPVDRKELIQEVRKGLDLRQTQIEQRSYTRQLEQLVHAQSERIDQAYGEAIRHLITASMYRDEETGAHVRRVGLCSGVLAKTLGWSESQIAVIRMAAPMHDVGKIGVPDAILCKPGKLTEEEFAIMKQHTTIGAGMLSGSASPMLQMAETIARYHHERWDGTGYPEGLAGEAIPECARIVSLVDVYDALTHARVYRPAFAEEKALEIIREGIGSQFDPRVAEAFFQSLPQIRLVSAGHPEDLAS